MSSTSAGAGGGGGRDVELFGEPRRLAKKENRDCLVPGAPAVTGRASSPELRARSRPDVRGLAKSSFSCAVLRLRIWSS